MSVFGRIADFLSRRRPRGTDRREQWWDDRIASTAGDPRSQVDLLISRIRADIHKLPADQQPAAWELLGEHLQAAFEELDTWH